MFYNTFYEGLKEIIYILKRTGVNRSRNLHINQLVDQSYRNSYSNNKNTHTAIVMLLKIIICVSITFNPILIGVKGMILLYFNV